MVDSYPPLNGGFYSTTLSIDQLITLEGSHCESAVVDYHVYGQMESFDTFMVCESSSRSLSMVIARGLNLFFTIPWKIIKFVCFQPIYVC